jgi:hypothetical protein
VRRDGRGELAGIPPRRPDLPPSRGFATPAPAVCAGVLPGRSVGTVAIGAELQRDWRHNSGGPLIGGLVTSFISWRASFILQVLIVVAIIWLGRGIADPPLPAQRQVFDWLGAVLSAVGPFFVISVFLQQVCGFP